MSTPFPAPLLLPLSAHERVHRELSASADVRLNSITYLSLVFPRALCLKNEARHADSLALRLGGELTIAAELAVIAVQT